MVRRSVMAAEVQFNHVYFASTWKREMKIGLIYPARSKAHTYASNLPPLREFFEHNAYVPKFFHPSLSLLTVAGLTPDEHAVTLIDERVGDIDFSTDFDIVGITMMTAQACRGYEIADGFRKRGVYVVLGGIHPTLEVDEARLHADTIVIGEAENTWPQFLSDYQEGVARREYHDNTVDINQSPVPRYDLINKKAFDLYPIQTTRGCPYDCSFCSVKAVFGPRYRVKDTTQVLRELEAVCDVSPDRHCVFNDDNMFVNRKKAHELLDAISGYHIKYFAETDISVADDDELLSLLERSGCTTLFIGLESIVPENLANIQKSRFKYKNMVYYDERCRKIHDHGMQVLGSFMVGLDYDTRDSLLRTRDFVLDNKIWAQYLFYTPFPGTRIREEFIADGRIAATDSDWNRYTCFDCVIPPLRMSVPELEETVVEMYETTYNTAAHWNRLRLMCHQLNALHQ